MTEGNREILRFRGPGSGGKGSARTKGRQIDPATVEEISDLLGNLPRSRDYLIEGLHLIQDRYRALSPDRLAAIGELYRLSLAEVYETATFYHHFDVLDDDEDHPPEITIRVCDSVTCAMFGAENLLRDLNTADLENVRVTHAPCMGACDRAPAVAVGKNQIGRASTATITKAISEKATSPVIPGHIDYDTYLLEGGYETLRKCLRGDLSREDVISRLESSELRGLGGAGFPTGRKWRIVSDFGGPRLMAVNADEG